MRLAIYPWFGKEFIQLSAEGRPGVPADQAAADIFTRMDAALKEQGLSLANTVRSRLWGKDRESRDAGSTQRVKLLAGKARSASSSYISPTHFDGDATVAIDLWAMRGSGEKRLQEYDPAIVPLRFLVYDGVAVLSGVTYDQGTLEDQLDNILPRIGESLKLAGAGWEKVARMSCHLHRSQTPDALRAGLSKRLGASLPDYEVSFVDGYSSPGKLVEIETTAAL
jgi:enamine deaminase RidA (YjgF/YER057c/UK114 family)